MFGFVVIVALVFIYRECRKLKRQRTVAPAGVVTVVQQEMVTHVQPYTAPPEASSEPSLHQSATAGALRGGSQGPVASGSVPLNNSSGFQSMRSMSTHGSGRSLHANVPVAAPVPTGMVVMSPVTDGRGNVGVMPMVVPTLVTAVPMIGAPSEVGAHPISQFVPNEVLSKMDPFVLGEEVKARYDCARVYVMSFGILLIRRFRRANSRPQLKSARSADGDLDLSKYRSGAPRRTPLRRTPSSRHMQRSTGAGGSSRSLTHTHSAHSLIRSSSVRSMTRSPTNRSITRTPSARSMLAHGLERAATASVGSGVALQLNGSDDAASGADGNSDAGRSALAAVADWDEVNSSKPDRDELWVGALGGSSGFVASQE